MAAPPRPRTGAATKRPPSRSPPRSMPARRPSTRPRPPSRRRRSRGWRSNCRRTPIPVIWVRRGHRVEMRTEPGGGELVTRAGKRTEFGSPTVLGRRQAGGPVGRGEHPVARQRPARLDPARPQAAARRLDADLDRHRRLRPQRRAAGGRQGRARLPGHGRARPAATRRSGASRSPTPSAATSTRPTGAARWRSRPPSRTCRRAGSAATGSRSTAPPGPLGVAISHGCVRAADPDVSRARQQGPARDPGVHPLVASGSGRGGLLGERAPRRRPASSSMSASTSRSPASPKKTPPS